MDNEIHHHCIICSSTIDTTDWGEEQPYIYICSDCIDSFPSSYLNERIECYKNGINKEEFDLLEYRLTVGDLHAKYDEHHDNDHYCVIFDNK